MGKIHINNKGIDEIYNLIVYCEQQDLVYNDLSNEVKLLIFNSLNFQFYLINLELEKLKEELDPFMRKILNVIIKIIETKKKLLLKLRRLL